MANSDITYTRSGAAAAYNEFQPVAVANLGTVDTSCNVDFSLCSLAKMTSSNASPVLTPINIGVGRTVKLHIRSGATAPTLTWGTTISPTLNWLGTVAPTFTNSKMTVVTLTNDGTETVGSFVVEG